MSAEFPALQDYPKEPSRLGLGVAIALGLHLALAGVLCLFFLFFGIGSLKELLEQGGSIATSGPAPEQTLIVELKLDDLKPPPTDRIEFIQQILKPKPQPVLPKPEPKPEPQPVKPIVAAKPKFTAPKATGSGTSDTVSSLVVGTSGFPHPPYPYQALSQHLGGTVMMRVSFDGGGAVSAAQVIQPSGVAVLDASSRNFILGHWKNASMAGRTVVVPIKYVPPN